MLYNDPFSEFRQDRDQVNQPCAGGNEISIILLFFFTKTPDNFTRQRECSSRKDVKAIYLDFIPPTMKKHWFSLEQPGMWQLELFGHVVCVHMEGKESLEEIKVLIWIYSLIKTVLHFSD